MFLDANNPSDLLKEFSSSKSLVDDKSNIELKPSLRTIKSEHSTFNVRFSHSIKPEPGPSNHNDNAEFSCKKPPSEFDYQNNKEVVEDEYYETKIREQRVPIDQDILLENMREDHNLRLKPGVLMGVRAEEGIRVSFYYFFFIF